MMGDAQPNQGDRTWRGARAGRRQEKRRERSRRRLRGNGLGRQGLGESAHQTAFRLLTSAAMLGNHGWRTVRILSRNSIVSTSRSRGTIFLFFFGVLGVLGGLLALWITTGQQSRHVVTSAPYRKLAFDFRCRPANTTRQNATFESDGLQCAPVANDTIALLDTIDILAQVSQPNQRLGTQHLLDHLSSLMMNGLPIVGLSDFVRVSDFINKYVGPSMRSHIMSSSFLSDQFSNFLDIRQKVVVLTPKNDWTTGFQSFLHSKTGLSMLNITVADSSAMHRFDADERVLCIIDIQPPFFANYTSFEDHFRDDGNEGVRFSPPTVTIRMPPGSVPDTRNYAWSPLKRALVPQQAGAVLYFLSGFLSVQIDVQNFLRQRLFSAPPLTSDDVLTEVAEDVFPFSKDLMAVARILATHSELNSSSLAAIHNHVLQIQHQRPLFFPYYHRALPSLGYSQLTFWRSFSTVMVIALVLLFSLPAATTVASFRREVSEGLVDVLSTLTHVHTLHSVIAWGLCSIWISLLLTALAFGFFAIVLQQSPAWLACAALFNMSIGLIPISGMLGMVVRQADTVVLLVPLCAFVCLLPGLMYSTLAFDIQRTFFYEAVLCLGNPVSACALVLLLIFRFESLQSELTTWTPAPTSGTPIIAYIALQAVSVVALVAIWLGLQSWRDYRRRRFRHVVHFDVAGTVALRAVSISKLFPSATHNAGVVLQQVSGKLNRNALTVLLGGNGAGKTTLMKILAELDRNHDGAVHLNINSQYDSRRRIGWCPQTDALWPLLTVEEHIRLFQLLLHEEGQSQETFLDALGLAEHSRKPAHALSGGMKRRLMLLLAMLGNPALLLCDEATSGCDAMTRELIRRVLLQYKRNSCVLVSTHHIDDIEVLADRVWFLNDHSLDLDEDVGSLIPRSLTFSTTDPLVVKEFERWRRRNSPLTITKSYGDSTSPPISPTWSLPSQTAHSWTISSSGLESTNQLLETLESKDLQRWTLSHTPLFTSLCQLYQPAEQPATHDESNQILSYMDWMSTSAGVRQLQAILWLRWIELGIRWPAFTISQLFLPCLICFLVALYCNDVMYPSIRLSSVDILEGGQAIAVTATDPSWLAHWTQPESSSLQFRSDQSSFNGSSYLHSLHLAPWPMMTSEAFTTNATLQSEVSRDSIGAVVGKDQVVDFLETSLCVASSILYPALQSDLDAIHHSLCHDDPEVWQSSPIARSNIGHSSSVEKNRQEQESEDAECAHGYERIASWSFCSSTPQLAIQLYSRKSSVPTAFPRPPPSESSDPGSQQHDQLIVLKLYRAASTQCSLLTNITADHAVPIFLKEILPPLGDLLPSSSTVYDPLYNLQSHPLHWAGHINKSFLERGFLGAFLILLFLLLLAVPAPIVLIRMRNKGEKQSLHLAGASLWAYYGSNFFMDALAVSASVLALYATLLVAPNPVHDFFLYDGPSLCALLFFSYAFAGSAGNYALCVLLSDTLAGPLFILVDTVFAGAFLKFFLDRWHDHWLAGWMKIVFRMVSPAYCFSSAMFRVFEMYAHDKVFKAASASHSAANDTDLALARDVQGCVWLILVQGLVYLLLCVACDRYQLEVRTWLARLNYRWSALNMNQRMAAILQYREKREHSGPAPDLERRRKMSDLEQLGKDLQVKLQDYRVGIFPPALPALPRRGSPTEDGATRAETGTHRTWKSWIFGSSAAALQANDSLQAFDGPGVVEESRPLLAPSQAGQTRRPTYGAALAGEAPERHSDEASTDLEEGMERRHGFQDGGLSALLSADQLSVVYPGQSRMALYDMNATVHPGDRIALLGMNGGGKSTFFRTCLSQVVPCHGHLHLSGRESVRDMWSIGPSALLGYVSQENILPSYLTVAQTLAIFGAMREVPPGCKLGHGLPTCSEQKIGEILPTKYLHTALSALSGGTRKKVQLLVANLHSPRLLLLDEATTAVDPIAAEGIVRHIHSLRTRHQAEAPSFASGSGLILTSHRIEDCLLLCDRVWLLVEGQKVMDVPMSVFQAIASDYYQVDLVLGGADAVSLSLQDFPIERKVVYSPSYLRLTLQKHRMPLSRLLNRLASWSAQHLVVEYSLRGMEMEEVLAAIIALASAED